MLRSLSIRDVVLIEKLDLEFESGLSVLTGETGAGKSILLDSLGLALGVRADASLLRQGSEQASVTAAFDPVNNEIVELLADQGITPDIPGEGLILKRILGKDGRSRAYVNGEPASVGVLRSVGDKLAEIHGQFENQRMLNQATHMGLLDAYGALTGAVSKVSGLWTGWREKEIAVAEAQAAYEKARIEEDFLRHAVEELTEIGPQPGEEQELAETRTFMMNGEKIAEGMEGASKELRNGRGVESSLQSAAKHLTRLAEKIDARFEPVIGALDRASAEVADAQSELQRLKADLDLNPANLERTEERLFALRALARKHGVEVDALADLQQKFLESLESIDNGAKNIDGLRAEAAAARAGYQDAASALSDARKKSAKGLQTAVNNELAPLKLGAANFHVPVDALAEGEWGAHGMDRGSFLVSTNPGSAPGPIGKVASGGEMARFMLALKVVLAKADPVPTIIFDEVDSGIGGATAAAVGERLAGLAADVQVLV
ncbi:MAG: DNA repair protein RecN, partial [Rhodospirillales bacterium]|nr:DNA repair protein RecN [Rhodospirillales bacterium]